MSHLGDLLSALVDGELCGAELDRANAHLAACGTCQCEAQTLRRLKQQLRALAADVTVDDLTSRLLAISDVAARAGQASPDQDPDPAPAGPGGPVSARLLRGPYSARRRRRAGPPAPVAARRPGGPAGRRRGRQVLMGALSLVVVGIGSAAFGLGAAGPSEPRIAPQFEMFDQQHAATTGSMPFPDPEVFAEPVPTTGRVRAQ